NLFHEGREMRPREVPLLVLPLPIGGGVFRLTELHPERERLARDQTASEVCELLVLQIPVAALQSFQPIVAGHLRWRKVSTTYELVPSVVAVCDCRRGLRVAQCVHREYSDGERHNDGPELPIPRREPTPLLDVRLDRRTRNGCSLGTSSSRRVFESG